VLWRLFKNNKIQSIGKGITHSGLRDLFKPITKDKFCKIIGATITNTNKYLSKYAICKKLNLHRRVVERLIKQKVIKFAGTAIGSGHGNLTNYYYKTNIKFIKKKLGITLLNTDNLFTLSSLAKKVGIDRYNIKYLINKGKIKSAGTGLAGGHNKGYVDYYKFIPKKKIYQYLGVTLNNTKNLLVFTQLAKHLGTTKRRLRSLIKKGKIKPVGKAFSKSGIVDYYKKLNKKQFNKITGSYLNNVNKYKNIEELVKSLNFSRSVIERLIKLKKIKFVGKGVSRNGITNYYENISTNRLKKLLGIDLIRTEGLISFTNLYKKLGTHRKKLHKLINNNVIKPKGKGITKKGTGYYFLNPTKKRINEIKLKYI